MQARGLVRQPELDAIDNAGSGFMRPQADSASACARAMDAITSATEAVSFFA